MSNIRDISCKLMKSPKELASWNFPLSEILEKYFSVLPEPCNIRYGEAALVIQNSVNAYVRKVEDLYDETKCLNEKMFTSTVPDKNKQKNKRSRNIFIDFDQFEFIKFNEDIGQHINLKSYKSRPLKFFHQCFSQLENSCMKLSTGIFDEKKNTIGKKHDYRCNQQMMKNGMLIEEVSSEYFQQPLFYENSEIALSNETFESNNILRYFTSETELMPFNDDITNSSFKNVESNFTDPLLNLSSEDNYNESIDIVNESDFFPSCDLQNDEFENSYSFCQDLISSDIQNSQTSDFFQSDVPVQVDKNRNVNVNAKKKLLFLSNINELKKKTTELMFSNYYSENKISSINNINNKGLVLRRSKRVKQKEKISCIIDDLKIIKPIPFLDGVPNKSNYSKNKFYSNISRRVHRYKKVKSKNVMNDLFYDGTSLKNMSKIFGTNNIVKNKSPFLKLHGVKMKKECNNDFQLNIFKTSNTKKCFAVNYEPVTTVTMDLLGFHQDHDKECSSFKSLKNTSFQSNTSYVSALSSISKNVTTTNLFQKNFFGLNEKKAKYESICVKSCHFDAIIKSKIKEIREELDLLTEDDHKVAKWHEEIKLKLLEAKHKPPFRMHDYELRIMEKLEKCNRKINFEKLIEKEQPCETARFFTATLQLASTNTLNIFINEDISDGIEVTLTDHE